MNIQWIIFITLILIILESWLGGKYLLKGVEYKRYFSVTRAFQGQEIEMIERISNRKILPVPWLRIESKISENLEFYKQQNLDIKHKAFHRSIFSLMPYTAIKRRHRVKCKKRGCYRLSSAALTCGDLFGLYDTSKTYKLDTELLVFPKLLDLNNIPLPSRSYMGEVMVKRWIMEDPFMYSGVRQYTGGDPLREINWNATARTGNLQVHKRDYTADPRVMIYLNMDISEDMWGPITEPDLLEKGISYGASIIKHWIGQGVETGFGTNGYIIDEPKQPVRISPQGGEDHLFFILETMARLVIDRRVTFYTYLEEDIMDLSGAAGRGNTDYLFITSFVSAGMRNQIRKMEDMGNSVEIMELSHGV